jgi:hypothetical protein
VKCHAARRVTGRRHRHCLGAAAEVDYLAFVELAVDAYRLDRSVRRPRPEDSARPRLSAKGPAIM